MAIRADKLTVGRWLQGKCGRVEFHGQITELRGVTVVIRQEDDTEREICPIWCDPLLVDGCPTEKYKIHQVKPKETNAMYPLKDKRCYDCRKKFSPHSGVQKYCDPCREKRGRPPAPASAQEAPVQPKAPATPPAAAASAERQTLADKIMASVPSAQPPVPPAGPGEVTSPAPAAAAPAVAAVAAATASSVGSGAQDRSPAGVGGRAPRLKQTLP